MEESSHALSPPSAASSTKELEVSREQKLIEKMALFEGRLEALQSLKSNLY
jgi:hypothetical protein